METILQFIWVLLWLTFIAFIYMLLIILPMVNYISKKIKKQVDKEFNNNN